MTEKGYKAHVKGLLQSVVGADAALESVILDMVQDGVKDSEKIIFNISMDLFGYEGFDWINFYKRLKLSSHGGCPAPESDSDTL